MGKIQYIIAGGGCAGLSLAYYISQDPSLSNKEILIIDRDEKIKNDRTWCFWTDKSTAFDDIIFKEWKNLTFSSDTGTRKQKLAKSSYKILNGSDFYAFIKARLAKFSNIKWLRADINEVGEDENGPFVVANQQKYHSEWVFNSCFSLRQFKKGEGDYHSLLQHFKGWRIKTAQPIFNEAEMTLMDFRTPQHNTARFFYVLPFSSKEALVEYTIFSDQLLDPKAYDEALKTYIKKTLYIEHFTINEEEFGVIPMSDAPLPKSHGKHIVNIGTLSGAVKPTTGYAFLRIQKQVKQIVEKLAQEQEPKVFFNTSNRFRFYDILLLRILQSDGGIAHRIFSKLFFFNKINRILTFLDERSNLVQEGRIFASLPIKPFLKALWETKFKNIISKSLLPSKSISVKRT